MLPFRRRLVVALTGYALLTLMLAACGTLDNEVHITYRSPTQVATTITLHGTGPMKNVLLAGDLRDSLSRAGWTVSSDDGGESAATLSASYESSDGSTFPNTSARARSANPGQALFRNLDATTNDSLFTRQLT